MPEKEEFDPCAVGADADGTDSLEGAAGTESYDATDELVKQDEIATFNYPTMQRLRDIATAAKGWPVVVGIPGVKFLHIRPIKYADETVVEKNNRLALEDELASYPTRRFPAPARPQGGQRDEGQKKPKAPMKARSI